MTISSRDLNSQNRENAAPSKKDGPRINREIRVPEVRLVDPDGQMLGITGINEAIKMAEDFGLDLVEISPNAEPPVCKILDFGKYKYEEQKKKAEARKKQKIIQIKEIKVRPGIEEHDYQVKMRQVKTFLSEGDKVKITLRFRGREMAHMNIAIKVLDRIKLEFEELAKIEQSPKMEGKQMIMILGPINAK